MVGVGGSVGGSDTMSSRRLSGVPDFLQNGEVRCSGDSVRFIGVSGRRGVEGVRGEQTRHTIS
jgi:hypothetical protein